MAQRVIPRGKKLSLMRGGTSVTGGIPMILEEDITLSLSSSFGKLVDVNNNPWVTALGMEAGRLMGTGFSGQVKQFGFQVWESTDPLSFQPTVTFHMGINNQWDAYREVYEPAMRLAGLPLPAEGASAGSITNLQPPGPPASSLFQELDDQGYGGRYQPISMQIARILYVNMVIVKKAEPTFSSEVDESGNPMWAKVSLDIQSVNTATVEMIQSRTSEDIGGGGGGQGGAGFNPNQ